MTTTPTTTDLAAAIRESIDTDSQVRIDIGTVAPHDVLAQLPCHVADYATADPDDADHMIDVAGTTTGGDVWRLLLVRAAVVEVGGCGEVIDLEADELCAYIRTSVTIGDAEYPICCSVGVPRSDHGSAVASGADSSYGSRTAWLEDYSDLGDVPTVWRDDVQSALIRECARLLAEAVEARTITCGCDACGCTETTRLIGYDGDELRPSDDSWGTSDDGEWHCAACCDYYVTEDTGYGSELVCSRLQGTRKCRHCGKRINWGSIQTGGPGVSMSMEGTCGCEGRIWTQTEHGPGEWVLGESVVLDDESEE